MPDVNYLGVLLAAISAFVLGGIWYSLLFGRRWMALSGQSEEKLKSGSPAMVFGLAFLAALVSAFVFAMLTRHVTDIGDGASFGFATGLGTAAASLGLTYVFERRPLGLWLVNGGYLVVQFTLYGVILTAMG